jgi:hypothetical protein
MVFVVEYICISPQRLFFENSEKFIVKDEYAVIA